VRIGIFDYGAGNLHSLAKALSSAEREVVVDTNPVAAAASDVLVLPGVGAFGPAAAALAPHRTRIREVLDGGLPCLGICLGMQLLCDSSEEGAGEGLGVFPGRATRLVADRVPQIGWNQLEDTTDPLLVDSGLTIAYYANGFVCRFDDASSVVSWSTHASDRFAAAVRRDRLMGVQFHPEKSSLPGLRFIDAFLEDVRR
jgi:glutamine amidotransferase